MTKTCPVCGNETKPLPNVYAMGNGYIYARNLDECSRCRRCWTSGQSRFVEHLSDAKASVMSRE